MTLASRPLGIVLVALSGLFLLVLAAVALELVASDTPSGQGQVAPSAYEQQPVAEGPNVRQDDRPQPSVLRSRDVAELTLSELMTTLTDRTYSPTTRNNAANLLLNASDPSLAGELVRMLRDSSESATWRNYCLQFLCLSYLQNQRADVLEAMTEACGYDEPKISSCAVWSLARVATPRDRRKTPDGETVERIRAAALDALSEKDAHFLIRTAGVQSCGRLGLAEALPDIREIAGNDNTKPTHLRKVAAAALGDLGDDSDLPLLERLASSARGQLKSAAALALRKIKKRAAKAPAAPSKRDERSRTEPSF